MHKVSVPLARSWYFFALFMSLVSSISGADMLTCGWNEVRALRVNGTNVNTLWTWTAINSELPDGYKSLFWTTDECKPVPGGRVLITSSGGGVALVDRATTNVLFYARVANAHSAELLPLNRVVASANETNGNRLVLFDLSKPDVELFGMQVWGAHGVVWDEQRQSLWSLATSTLAEFKLTNWNSNPSFVMANSWNLPDGDGHDLCAVPDTSQLALSTALNCWLFNRDTGQFTKHPLLGDALGVKSISENPVSGQTVYVKNDSPAWWSESLRFLTPANTINFPGDHFYKARWIPPEVPPKIFIQPAGGVLRVSWPAVWTNYTLLQNLSYSSTNWSAPIESTTDDGTNRFILVNPTKGQVMYRLVRN